MVHILIEELKGLERAESTLGRANWHLGHGWGGFALYREGQIPWSEADGGNTATCPYLTNLHGETVRNLNTNFSPV